MVRRFALAAVTFLVLSGLAGAQEFRFKEGKSGAGELRYIGNTPVLIVSGTPEEMGEQTAKLATDAAPGVTDYFHRLMHANHLEKAMPALIMMANGLFKRFPDAYKRELDSIIKTYGKDRDLIVVGNTLWDIGKLGGCAAFIVEPSRSKSGEPIVGRNFDFPTLGTLHQFSILMIYKPTGKYAFASVTFPPIIGVTSGMNEKGLSVAVVDIPSTSDGSPRLNLSAVPMILSFRRILEECTTVEEAEKILRATPRTTLLNLAVCDKTHGAIFELTPKNVIRRSCECGLCYSTNHFRTPELATNLICWRYALMDACKVEPLIGLDDVKKKMHQVNQGEQTIQTMVFEPASVRMHVGLGKGPISAKPLDLVDLKTLFKEGTPFEGTDAPGRSTP